MKPIDYAKAYLDFGWSLIPIVPETKKPAVKWAEFQERRPTLKEVEGWINKGWYLAVVTGDISGILIVDDDRVKHNLIEWGFDSPVISTSENKGKHYYFLYDREIHSHANTKLFIDLKAWHSYCLVPPFKGRTWVSKPSENLLKLQPISDEIVRLINSDMEREGRSEPLQMADFLNIEDGARTSSLYRIACSIFSKVDKDDGLRILAGVNQTYSPPLDDREFKYNTSRAYEFVSNNASQTKNNGITSSLTSVKSIEVSKNNIEWPAPLAPEAFHGPIGELVKAIAPHTEADEAAILIGFLLAFGNVIGKNPHFKVEADRHPMRLNAVLVGSTATGRKGTASSYIKKIFRDIDDLWTSKITTGLSSGEGLIWAVRDEITKTKKTKDGDFVEEIVDEGIADKRLLVIEGEFSQTLRVMAREGNTLSSVLRNAWDTSDVLQTLTKNSPAKATGAHISIFANITSEELTRYLTDTDSNNGFANRFLWVCTRRSKYLPRGGKLKGTDLDPFINKIKDAVQYATNIEEIDRSEATWQIWETVYPELSGGREGLIGALTSRADANVTRISCIYALLDQSDIVEPEHLSAALAVWQYVEDSVRYIFQNRTGDQLADRIYENLQQRNLTSTDIYNLFDRHQKSSRIKEALSLLESVGRIEKIKETSGGADITLWSIAKEKEAIRA